MKEHPWRDANTNKKQLLETGVTTYLLSASPNYLETNTQWKKLISLEPLKPAMEVYIKVHMEYKIKQIHDPRLHATSTKMKEVFPAKHFIPKYQKDTLDQLLKVQRKNQQCPWIKV